MSNDDLRITDALNFVRGSTARKDLVPVLRHFRIQNKRITGFNGTLALSAPIPTTVECAPLADMFYKAVEACEAVGTPSLNLEDESEIPEPEDYKDTKRCPRLILATRGFASFIDCVSAADFPDIRPQGQRHTLNGFLSGLRRLRGFVGEDASRPYCRAILTDGQVACATTNVVVAQLLVGEERTFDSPVSIPVEAVDEMIRLKEEPTACLVSANNITFLYSGERWLYTQLIESSWPEIGQLLDSLPGETSGMVQTGPELFDLVQKLSKFTDGPIYFREEVVSTSPTPEIAGTTYAIDHGFPDCAFHAEQFLLLKDCSPLINASNYPEPCFFTDHSQTLRGAIVGLRV